MDPVMSNLIAELRTAELAAAEPGQLIDRGRIFDHLLDLRLEAGADSALVSMIDGVLASVPGKSVVELVWWRDTLDQIADAAECLPTA
ncbi:MAG: hypothetical protein R2733_03890 [Acidimicrobiales bacterium]